MADNPSGSGRSEEDFDRLFRAHYADLYRYALRRCPTRQDAEDLVAETFAVAWRRLLDVPSGRAARLWLFGTARLLRMNQFRSLSRRRSLLERIKAWNPTSPRPDVAMGASDRSRIGRALAALSETDREVLLLTAWEGLSSTEVADAMDITPAAARKRLQRARNRFRDELLGATASCSPTPLTAKETGR